MEIIMNKDEDDLEKFRDGELFKIIAQESEQSEAAFTVFYDRYKDDFYKLACKIASDETLAQELFLETMETAYFKADKFKAEENLSLKAERGRTLTWLKTIAKNIFVKKFRDQQKIPKTFSLDSNNSHNEITDVIEKITQNGKVTNENLNHIRLEVENSSLGITDSGNEYISLERSILQKVLSQLSDRDRDILFAYILEVDPNIKNQKISRKTLKELREKYNVTSDYIRKLKEQIFIKVNEECKNQMAEKTERKI